MIEHYTVRGAYSVATGKRLPDEHHTREELGYARLVTREDSEERKRRAFDCTTWGAGHVFMSGFPGAAVLNDDGLTLDLSTGRVYIDSRLKGVTQ